MNRIRISLLHKRIMGYRRGADCEFANKPRTEGEDRCNPNLKNDIASDPDAGGKDAGLDR